MAWAGRGAAAIDVSSTPVGGGGTKLLDRCHGRVAFVSSFCRRFAGAVSHFSCACCIYAYLLCVFKWGFQYCCCMYVLLKANDPSLQCVCIQPHIAMRMYLYVDVHHCACAYVCFVCSFVNCCFFTYMFFLRYDMWYSFLSLNQAICCSSAAVALVFLVVM